MSMYLYNSTTKHWDIPWEGTGGAAHVLPTAFAVSPISADGVALSATAVTQIVALGEATHIIITGAQATAASIRIDFGDSGIIAVDTTDTLVNVGKSVPARVLKIPIGSTFMAYIRDNAEVANIPFSLVRA